MYRKLQVFYHQFLTSAIAVLFLASVHAPVRFSERCRNEFYLALELVKDLSTKSWVSKRLWRTIRSLKQVAPRFGLQKQDGDEMNSASDSRLGDAAVNDGNFHMTTQKSAAFPQQRNQTNDIASLGQRTRSNGSEIQSEMTRIFEDSVGPPYNLATPPNGQPELLTSRDSASDGPIYAMENNFFHHFSDMF
jgi:hypothetical protein